MAVSQKYEGHALQHDALATAVRVAIEIESVSRVGKPSPSLVEMYERVCQEVEKWADTDDVYAQGIMAPLNALGKV